jgi:RNA polymerase sigma-70 factor (ECF subfamily)
MGGGRAIERSNRETAMVSPTSFHSRRGGLEAVYLERRDALVRFVRARGAGEHAEDVVQELWLKLSTAPSTPIADPVGYLYRAANNLMISRHRSAERTGRRDLDWVETGSSEDRSGEEALEARQEIERAEARLRALGERVLHAFVLFRVEGMPQREIAERLGVSLSAVEKDLQRAYRAIAGLKEASDAV